MARDELRDRDPDGVAPLVHRDRADRGTDVEGVVTFPVTGLTFEMVPSPLFATQSASNPEARSVGRTPTRTGAPAAPVDWVDRDDDACDGIKGPDRSGAGLDVVDGARDLGRLPDVHGLRVDWSDGSGQVVGDPNLIEPCVYPGRALADVYRASHLRGPRVDPCQGPVAQDSPNVAATCRDVDVCDGSEAPRA